MLYSMKVTEKRTQIYLTEAQHGALTRVARRRGTSLAGVVREAVESYLSGPAAKARAQGEDPMADLIGFVSGPGNLADDHDEYLYPARRQQ